MGTNNVMFQTDNPTADASLDKNRICSGFYFMLHNTLAHFLLDPKRMDIETFNDDQTYINDLITQFGVEYDTFPKDLFPNGQVWMGRQR